MWLTKETARTGCLGGSENVVFRDIHEDVTCTRVQRLPPQLLADLPQHQPQELVCVTQWSLKLESFARPYQDHSRLSRLS